MSGRIEVICGSMFSGKTEELINRIKKSGKSYKVFKPKTDTRNKKNKIESHNKLEIKGVVEQDKALEKINIFLLKLINSKFIVDESVKLINAKNVELKKLGK